MWCDPSLPAGLGGLALCWLGALFPLGPAAVDRAFPVDGPTDYGAAHHDYPAVDVFADCGARVRAPVDGTVLEVGRVDRWTAVTDRGRQRGGKFVSVEGADGVRYYGSHLSSVRRGLGSGDHVEAGDALGRVGRTGSAAGTPCHLHVGLSPVCRENGDWAVRRGVVNPYRFLRSWERGGNLSPAPAVARWEQRHACAGGDPARP
jgi:murein DD-endopeptidase MepM/ murein hydrolase activator NlpD